MVNLLNGQIQVSSIPNEVTTFDVWLPVMEVTVDNEDEKVAEELVLSSDEQAVELKNSSVEFDKNKQTIMIIDDDPSMLWFVTEIFVGASLSQWSFLQLHEIGWQYLCHICLWNLQKADL